MPTHLPILQSPSGADDDALLVGSLRGDGTRAWVQPADVTGRFSRARRVVFAVLIAVWAVLPWVQVRGRPAVFLDVERRLFFLFGATFNAQDVWLAFFVLAAIALGLVAATSARGRVWCGWACPQTVFLEGVFRRVERWIEGPRNARMRRDAGALTFDRVWRKTLKHALFFVLAALVAHVFVAYFVSLPRLYAMVRARPSEHPEAFAWAAVLTAAFYVNFAHFREQLCLVVCPYGRLQSLLADRDTVTIAYDAARGEPRGKLRVHAHAPARDDAPADRGDCVDCNRCVVVCPTGIDIRNGLQLDCVGCTACADACDEVMVKLERPRGLIRHASLTELAGGPRRLWRPRTLAYAGAFVVLAIAATLATRARTDVEANLLRLAGPPFVIDGGVVRNGFELHLVNKTSAPIIARVDGDAPRGTTFVFSMQSVTLPPLGAVDVPFFTSASRADAVQGPIALRVSIRDLAPQRVYGIVLAPGASR